MQVKQLLRAKVACASPLYIVEWLAHPAADLSKFLMHGSKAGPDLARLEADRAKIGDERQQSCSL